MTAEGQDEPLLHVDVQAGAGTGAANPGGGFPWLTLLGFAFLTFNSLMAIYRSNGDSATVAFVVFSYVDMALLFCCLRWYERQEQRSGSRQRLQKRADIWLLATMLTVAFSCKVVAVVMPFLGHDLAWCIADATVLLGGFYFFFLYMRKIKKRGMLGVLGGIANPALRLIVDSGASMHAVGDPSLLCGLRYYPEPRLVTLSNDTDLNILGIGHIQLEDFWIPNVSLVLGLQRCLISTGQLDTDHGIITCMGKGKAEVMLSDGTIVGGAILEKDNMYVLRFLHVPKPATQESAAH